MAVVYSGDACYIMNENENMEYLTPNQGTNIWYDGMVITRDCSEVELAHRFIDFMIRGDSALANTQEVGYTSPVQSAYDEMTEEEYADVSAYIPDIDNPESEIFAYQDPKIRQKYAELWTKIKAEQG